MLGPYTSKLRGEINYKGNKLFSPIIQDISKTSYPVDEIENRVSQLESEKMWGHISKINHQINLSTNQFLDERGALFTSLPLITRMISSPGAVYGKEAIDYTTDTCPIRLKWFDQKEDAFLSESSQIYLELALLSEGVDEVYAIYNSFRKENADVTHLSEFHHIEYEGHVNQDENEKIALGLIGKITNDLLNNREENLSYFLREDKLNELGNLAQNIQNVPRITYEEALKALGSSVEPNERDRYKKFTMKDCFGSWEEIRLTEIFDGMVAIKHFPLLEVPFYHVEVDGSDPIVAENTDIIWPGYRETIGSGQRIGSKQELEKKAEIFNLPREDYKPYLASRDSPNYENSSGFGLGWERFLQGILEMPFIWSAVQFPRGHSTLKP